MGADRARIGIIGAGAIGCLGGGLLKRAGPGVPLIGPWQEHVEQIKARASGSPAAAASVVPITALHLHGWPRCGAVRGGLRGGEVLRHRVGHQLAVDCLRRPTAWSSIWGTASTTTGWPRWRPRAHPRLRHPDQRGHVRGRPRHRTDRGGARSEIGEHDQRLAARHPAGAIMSWRRGGDHQPVGRALVEAR
jgi:hypothetical protein